MSLQILWRVADRSHRVPRYRVACPVCFRRYVRSGWAYDMQRTKRCSDCRANRRTA